MPHRAIWITESAALEERVIEEEYKAGDHQLLVQVEYSGINPADMKHTMMGMKDLVAGYDYSGTVLGAPSGSRFAVGDRVAGTTPSGVSRGSRAGAHQDVIVAEESMAFKVPASMPMPDAAGLDIILRTAIIGLYHHLQLPLPWEQQQAGTKAGALLIYGAATQVGLCALQLAALSGAGPIYVTASPKNYDALKKLGATHCFDYRSETVFDDIKAAVAASGRPLTKVFDIIGPQPTGHIGDKCFAVTTDEASAKVATCGPMARRATFFFAMPDWACDLMRPDGLVWSQKDPAQAELMFEVFNWVVDNYGDKFKLPHVRAVPWKDAVAEIQKSAGWGNSFEKIVISR